MNIHIVQQGDAVWELANLYGISPQRVISDNGLQNSAGLVVGQALILLEPAVVYTVQQEDTLYSIAERFGITPITLIQNNPDLLIPSGPYAGQDLIIRFQDEKRRTVSINGYAYPHIQMNILERALPYLTYLTIFGYGFTETGELITIDDQPLINLAYQYQTAPVMLLSSITEDGNFSSAHASRLFQDLELQNKVIDNIITVMLEKGYLGLDIDFEYIEAKDSDAYIRFLQNITDRLHAYNFFVNTDLAPKISSEQEGLLYEAHDYGLIGAITDTVLLMTYEWGYTYGPPMAVAPLNKVREVISYAVTQIPPGKILMGIPNYGYDWPLPYERGITMATNIGNEEAIQIADQANVQIQFDTTAQSPYFEYWNNNREHIVWFEDVRSIQAKFELMDEFSLLGAGYWNLMRPFSQNWAFISALYEVRKIVTP